MKRRRYSVTHINQPLQGYLAHNNPTPCRTRQLPHALGSAVILGEWVFLMSKAPLRIVLPGHATEGSRVRLWRDQA